MAQTPPVRIVEVRRNGLHALGDGFDILIPPGPDATVGDWLLLNKFQPASSEILHRKSLFKRRAPGTSRELQLIAANVDTAFIVSSCNKDFNVARLERYLALAFEAGATPVIILTKAPDRWGRVLMRRAESARAKFTKEMVRTLSEADYLLGVNDEARQGALRFSLEDGGPYLTPQDKQSIPPLIDLPRLLSATERYLDDDETAEDLKI